MVADTNCVTLREITAATVYQITQLAVSEGQQTFVSSTANSLAEALFSEEAWYRAIYRGDLPVGFVMLYDESLRAAPTAAPRISLWRFLIDARFQGHGTGAQALDRIIEHVQNQGLFASLTTSYVPGPGCPEQFYLRAGFEHTGRVEYGEVILELPLQATAQAPVPA